jgi:ketosteroid isomerase-like protein
MSDDAPDFDAFLLERTHAAEAYVNGDAGPLSLLSARRTDATFFGPGGGVVHGADAVVARYASDAPMFEPGSTTRLEILHAAASGDVGYWVGYQHALARLKGKPEPVPMKLRVTEVFRREDGAWKLVHRHADMLAEAAAR